MPGNTKQLKKDVDQKPAPQYFDPVLDEYGYLYGSNGAARHILYGPDGNPITTSGNKLAVRANEVETLLNDIKGKDFATQTTLAAILAKIIAAPATEAKQDALAALIGEAQASPTANTLLARLKSLEDKIDAITSGATPATAQLTGSLVTVLDISADVGTIPAETTKYVDISPLPERVTKISVGGRFDNSVTNIELTNKIGDFTAPALCEDFTVITTLPSTAFITNKKEIKTDKPRISITAGPMDATVSTSSNSGVKIYCWRD